MGLYVFLALYMLALAALIFSKGNSKRNKKIFLFLTFGLFTILVSLRADSVGNDTTVYLDLYRKIDISQDLSVFFTRYEKGYIYLNKILSLVSHNPQTILIVTTCFVMYGYARFIYKYSEITWLSVYLFFMFRFYDMTMVAIRLNIALVIILFSYDFLRDRKLIKFLALVFLASLFHRTAIIFLIVWPISYLSFNRKILLLFCSISILGYVSFSRVVETLFIFFPNYQYYLGSSYLDGEIRLASLIYLLIGISIIMIALYSNYYKVYSVKHTNKTYLEVVNNKADKKFFNDAQVMLLIIMIGTAINFLSLKFNLLDRIAFYFQVFSIVFLPNAIKAIKDKKEIILFIYLVIVLFSAYSISIQIFKPEWNNIYPYKFFWQNY